MSRPDDVDAPDPQARRYGRGLLIGVLIAAGAVVGFIIAIIVGLLTGIIPIIC